MKKLFFLIIAGTISFNANTQDGEKNFKSICASCHTIGKGRLVGPDLKNVHSKYEESWLLKWIRSSQTLVKLNDDKAVAVFKEFGEIPMPDNPQFSENDIKSIIAFVKTESEKTPEAAASAAKTAQQLTQGTGDTVAKENPANTFLYIGIGLVILFFLSILVILARSVIVLSNELKNQKNVKGI